MFMLVICTTRVLATFAMNFGLLSDYFPIRITLPVMPVFLILHEYAHSKLSKLNRILNPVLDSSGTQKFSWEDVSVV